MGFECLGLVSFLLCYLEFLFNMDKALWILEVEGYRARLFGYVQKITVSSRPERVKTALIRKATSWESLPQCSGFSEEAA